MKRLSPTCLSSLPADIVKPAFEPSRFEAGIVHLGIGAFHRAHQALYTDDVLGGSGGDWRILGVSLRHRRVAEQLNPQGGLYTLGVKSPQRRDYRIIGAVQGVLFAPERPQAVLERMSSPRTRVVTLSITEKGYCLNPSTGNLDESVPGVQADLACPERPTSALGFLVRALELRRRESIAPFTILCCDNLSSNGRLLRRLVTQHAMLKDEQLAAWIDREVAFPSTMIDRIVPATSCQDRVEAQSAMNVVDEGLVVSEPFSQWVIEDQFCAPRPAWEEVGVQLVRDVAPFELAKLRLLNGAHSTIAYLGYLSGYEYVHQAVADANLRDFVRQLMRLEIAPTLRFTENLNLDAYQRELMTRFENPALNHRTQQIAMDGSQKLPQRLLNTIEDRLEAQQSVHGLCLSIAAWVRYVQGRDEQGRAIDVEDPLSVRLGVLASDLSGDPSLALRGLLGVKEVFGENLPANPLFVDCLLSATKSLLRHGVRETVRRWLPKVDSSRSLRG